MFLSIDSGFDNVSNIIYYNTGIPLCFFITVKAQLKIEYLFLFIIDTTLSNFPEVFEANFWNARFFADFSILFDMDNSTNFLQDLGNNGLKNL